MEILGVLLAIPVLGFAADLVFRVFTILVSLYLGLFDF